jgi:hypothetical protein
MKKADNFDSSKWLIENKITTQSRLNEVTYNLETGEYEEDSPKNKNFTPKELDVMIGRDITLTTVGPEVTGTNYNKTTIMPKVRETSLAADKDEIENLK